MFNDETPPTHMTFGKYKGTSIKDMAKQDPDYVVWMLDNLSRLNEPTRLALEKAIGRTPNTLPQRKQWK